MDLLGASYFPDDLQCNPRGIARAMAHEAGVRVRTGTRAERILPGEGVRIADGHEGAGVGLGPLSGELVAAAMC